MSEHEERLQSILVAYIETAEAGRAPGRAELLTQYPEFASELAEFLDGRERMQRLVPPPPAVGEAATVAIGEPGQAGALGLVRYFGDYELLEEIARGGMGVVYSARQISLDRPVALKMILTGQLASDSDVRRFRQEAEAAANLDHPHIVPIYEVGEHNGLHFFSMKRLAGGLNHALDRFRDDPRAAAELLATVARAVHHAHQRGLLHRDLKPSNILLDERGQPHVCDFGLARRIQGGTRLTLTGAVVGTAEYMAPEQASARRVLTTAADVYSLGAVLYALLPGVPPFQGAGVLETLQQVVGSEPVPPRQRNPRIPRDVEVICLKCLRKEPEKRYGSAEALAEDLERWLRGEPIAARPVGRLERSIKWVRRNPVLAGMAAAVVLALLAGSVISTLFGIQAQRQAERAEQNANKLAAANDQLERTLARSLLRPLASQGLTQQVAEPEWDALWELALNRRGRLGLRFVEEASRTPLPSRQLRDRAALALSVAVGLDSERRSEVEAVLLARMEDPELGEEQKTDLAMAAAAWDGLSSAGAVGTAQQLIRAMRSARSHGPPNAFDPYSEQETLGDRRHLALVLGTVRAPPERPGGCTGSSQPPPGDEGHPGPRRPGVVSPGTGGAGGPDGRHRGRGPLRRGPEGRQGRCCPGVVVPESVSRGIPPGQQGGRDARCHTRAAHE